MNGTYTDNLAVSGTYTEKFTVPNDTGYFLQMNPQVAPDIIFHSGPNETRFTEKGMIYRGELVEDAGAAHAILMEVMTGQRALPTPQDEVIAQLQTEIKRLATLAQKNDNDAEMYVKAWQRELAGFLVPKSHHIDMMVVSTQRLVQRCRQAERRVAALEALQPAAAPETQALMPPSDSPAPCALSSLAMVIDQLEAAIQADRKLDHLIAAELGIAQGADVPHYTARFEDALTLVQPGKDYQLTVNGSGTDGETYTCTGFKWWPRPEDKPSWRVEMGNKLAPSLAVCIAALKVRLAWAEECGAGVVRSAA